MNPGAPVPASHFELLFRSAPAALLVMAPDEQFTILAASDEYLRATGRRRSELVGRGVLEAFPENPAAQHESAPKRVRASLQRVLARRQPDAMPVQKYDMPRPAREGGGFEARYWSVRNVPVLSDAGELLYIVHRAEDITAEVHAAERAHEEQPPASSVHAEAPRRARDEVGAYRSQLYRVFQDLPAAVAVLRGPDLIYDLANERYCEIVGQHDLSGRAIRDALPELQEQGYLDLLAHVYRTGEPFHGNELPMKLKGRPDSAAFFTLAFQPLHGLQGTVEGVLVFAFDVTELAEARQREQALAYEAQLANHRKNEFLSMLAHELRNPLAGLSSALSLLQRPSTDENRGARLRELCQRQVGNLSRLVDDLLDVARISRGKMQLHKAPMDLSTSVEQAAEASRPLMESREHRLEVRVAPGPYPLEGDSTRIEQALANLLNNAAKYTPSGGCIDVELAREQRPQGPVAVVKVRDNGQGIPEQRLPHIFDLFVQLDPGIDRYQGGLGIGLTLVRRLVEMHRGRVKAYSEGPDRGSTFTIELPLSERISIPQPSAPAASPHNGSAGRHVLLIEDNDDARETLQELLSELGHEVDTARTGTEGLRKLLENHPDAVIVDIGLPEIDGFELARRARAANENPPQLIALSGYSGEDIQRQAEGAGFDHRLVKPVNLEQLGAILSRH
jgi:PAS domain S-box-containing protein